MSHPFAPALRWASERRLLGLAMFAAGALLAFGEPASLVARISTNHNETLIDAE